MFGTTTNNIKISTMTVVLLFFTFIHFSFAADANNLRAVVTDGNKFHDKNVQSSSSSTDAGEASIGSNGAGFYGAEPIPIGCHSLCGLSSHFKTNTEDPMTCLHACKKCTNNDPFNKDESTNCFCRRQVLLMENFNDMDECKQEIKMIFDDCPFPICD